MGWLFEDENERRAKAEKAAAAASKLTSTQEEFRKKLEESHLLKVITEEWQAVAAEENYRWMLQTKGYTDTRERTIVVTKEAVLVLDCQKSEFSLLGAALNKAARTAVLGVFSNKAMNRAIELQAAADKDAAELVSKQHYIFSYTAYGYFPLRDYRSPSGGVVDSQVGAKIWASVLAKALKKMSPELNVDPLIFDISCDLFGGHAYGISYTVPDYPWKNWF